MAKITVNYTDCPELAELDFLGLLFERNRCASKETFFKSKKRDLSDVLRTIIETVKVDSVLYSDDTGRSWTTTLIKEEPGTNLDEDKLRENLMKLGKLDAEAVKVIFDASMVPTDPKDPYIKVTVSKARNI